MAEETERYKLIARTATKAAQSLRRIWAIRGGLISGGEIGLVLTEVYYSSNPWVTAQFVTERLAGAYSYDTIRRRLEDLVDISRAEVVEMGGRKLFRASADAAGATIRVLQIAHDALSDPA